MDSDRIEKFINEIYQPRLEWYDKKSIRYKRLAYIFNILIIILVSSAPISASLIFIFNTRATRVITIGITFFLLVLTGIKNYCRFDKVWHSYRNSWELLKREKINFEYELGEYQDFNNPKKLFVKNVRNILSEEHKKWRMMQRFKEFK